MRVIVNMNKKRIVNISLIGAICIVVIIGFIYCRINDKNTNTEESVKSENQKTYSYTEELEVYFEKYPELITLEVAFPQDRWSRMVVSPYISDEVVRSVAHVIYETKMSAYCYGICLYDEDKDEIDNIEFETFYKCVQERVDEARNQADSFNELFSAELEKDKLVHISEDGEYYYIIDMSNYEESAIAIADSIEKQYDYFPYKMKAYYDFYFSYEWLEQQYLGGYRGYTYSIYKDEFIPDNKVYENFYWMAKNQYVDVNNELNRVLVFDYQIIVNEFKERMERNHQIECYSFSNSNEEGIVALNYRMCEEEFNPDQAIELAYELYYNIKKTNEEFNTHFIKGLSVRINNFMFYDEYYNKIEVFISVDDDYTKEQFKEYLINKTETDWESEPE